jgi:hypothetical protein
MAEMVCDWTKDVAKIATKVIHRDDLLFASDERRLPLSRGVLVPEFIEGVQVGALTSCGGRDYVARKFTEGVIFRGRLW